MEAPREGVPSLARAVLEMSQASGRDDLKYWEPEKLRPIHFQMVALSAAGKNNNEIADLLDVSPARVSVILNHPDAQILRAQMVAQIVEQTTDDTAQLIKAHAKEAFLRNVELMRTAAKEETRQRSIFDILDRAGFKPREVHVNTNINLGKEDAQMISDALRESEAEVPQYQEVESMEMLLNMDEDERKKRDPAADYGVGPDSQ